LSKIDTYTKLTENLPKIKAKVLLKGKVSDIGGGTCFLPCWLFIIRFLQRQIAFH